MSRTASRPPTAAPPPARVAETSRLARRAAINLVGSGVSATANILLVVLVTRGFGKDLAGSLFAATSLFVVLQTAGRGGADSALQYFMPRVQGPAAQRRLVGVVLVPLLAAAVGVAAVVVLWAGVLRHGLRDLDHPGTAPFLTALAVFLPLAVGHDLLLACSRALNRARPTVYLEQLARPLCQLALTIAVVVSGREQWLALAWAAPYALTVLPAFRASRPAGGESPDASSETTDFPATQAIWRFSGPRALAALSQITIQRLDIVLVAALRGVKDAALYTAATRFLVLGQLVNQAIGLPLQPRLGVLLAKKDLAAADDLYAVSTSWTVALAWPLYLSFAVYAAPSLLLFGHGYAGASDVVVLLSLAMLLATACGPVDLMLIMGGRTTWNLANTVASLTVFLVADLTLIPSYGATGAAVGWALAIATNNLLPLLQVRHHLGCWPVRLTSVLVAAASVVCFAALPLTARAVGGLSWPTAIVAAFVGCCCYLLVLWRLRQPLRLTGVGLRSHAR